MRLLILPLLLIGAFSTFYISKRVPNCGNVNHDTISKPPIDTIFIKVTAIDSFGSYCDRFEFECDCVCAEKIRFRIIDSLKTTLHKNEVIAIMVRNIDLPERRIIPDSTYLLGISKWTSVKAIFREDTPAIFWSCKIIPGI